MEAGPPEDDSDDTHHMYKQEFGAIQERLYFPGVGENAIWNFCNQVIDNKPLDYRSIETSCGISELQYRGIRQEILAFQYPRLATLGKQEILVPTPHLITFCRNIRETIRQDKVRRAESGAGGGLPDNEGWHPL